MELSLIMTSDKFLGVLVLSCCCLMRRPNQNHELGCVVFIRYDIEQKDIAVVIPYKKGFRHHVISSFGRIRCSLHYRVLNFQGLNLFISRIFVLLFFLMLMKFLLKARPLLWKRLPYLQINPQQTVLLPPQSRKIQAIILVLHQYLLQAQQYVSPPE